MIEIYLLRYFAKNSVKFNFIFVCDWSFVSKKLGIAHSSKGL
jgi:hypothetical protein